MIQDKNLILKWKNYIILLGILFFRINTYAQYEAIYLLLTDKETKKPISFAHYIIEGEKGVSDTDGKITFNNVPGAELQISHVLYGHIHIKPEEIEEAAMEKAEKTIMEK